MRVVRRPWVSASRRYFLTAERFSAAEAHRIGLVHESVPAHQFDDTETGRFFMRVGFNPVRDGALEAFMSRFPAIKAQFGMETVLRSADQPQRVMIMASQSDHCLSDLLYRRRIGELPITVSAIVATLMESVVVKGEERVVVGGTSNLARVGEDFSSSVGPVLEALEEHVVLLRLLGEESAADVNVRIGIENPVEELRSASVVSAGYGNDGNTVAHLGILGPTRMDYAGSISAVRAVARYVGHILMEQ